SRKTRVELPADIEALVVEVDTQSAPARRLRGGMEHEKALRTTEIDQARQRRRVKAGEPRHANGQLATGNQPVFQRRVSVIVRIRIANERLRLIGQAGKGAIEPRAGEGLAIDRREAPGQLIPQTRSRKDSVQFSRSCGKVASDPKAAGL